MSAFAQAVLSPAQPRIIGLRLRPYSLGHRLILTQLESAFVCGGIPLFADLVTSVFVCANTWEENQTMMRSRWRRWLQFKMWGAMAGRFDIPQALISFSTYIREGDVFPEQSASDNAVELGSCGMARLYLFLRASGFDESSTWNMPLNIANQLHAARLEEDRKISLVPVSTKALWDRLQKAHAE